MPPVPWRETTDRRRQYGGSLDARQHGYEHAYRDGADRGRQDRERRAAYSLKDNDYQIGARTYERAFGDRNQYMDGYREGYKAGYDDGFAGRDGQYSQLYARPQAGVRVSPRDDPYADRPYSSTDMAFDAGYREGVTIGQQDRGRNARSNYQEQFRLQERRPRLSLNLRRQAAVSDSIPRRHRAWL